MTPERAMKSHGDSLILVYAQDVGRGKVPFSEAVQTITADMLRYREGIPGTAAPPGSEVKAGADRVAEWVEGRLTSAAEAFRAGGHRAVRASLDAPTVAPQAPAAPALPLSEDRKRLITAMALEGAAKHNMPPERAVAAAREFVASKSDDEVRSTLASIPDRKWAMGADGKLAQPNADDPWVGLVRKMQADAGPLAQSHPSIVAAVSALAGKLSHLHDNHLRTRVAWVAQDMEKATGERLEMPAPLRADVEARWGTTPGLANPEMQKLLAETRRIGDPATVAAIRQQAVKMAREPAADQTSDQAMERVETLRERVRLRQSPPPALSQASPGPGPQAPPPLAPPPSPTPAGAQPPPASPRPQDRPGVAETLVRARGGAAMAGGPPWDAAPAGRGLGARIAHVRDLMADQMASRAVRVATDRGDEALKALQGLAQGPARPIMGRIAAAARSEPDGAAGVLKEMRAGGKHEALRTDFDKLMRRPAFLAAHAHAQEALSRFADSRVRAEDRVAASGLDPTRTANLARLDEQVADLAGRLPSRKEGSSVLDDVAGRAAQILREAADRAASAVVSMVSRARSAVSQAQAGASPSPAP